MFRWHVTIVLQISHRCFRPKYRKKAMFGKIEKGGREDPPGAVQPVCIRITARDIALSRPCSPVSAYSTEVERGQHDRVSEGQICDTYHIVTILGEDERNFTVFHFWARGYCVSTVSRRRGRYSGLHPQPGGRGKTPRAAKPQGALAPFRTVEAPSRGLHQTTRFAGGS